jgi:hypothetical protein
VGPGMPPRLTCGTSIRHLTDEYMIFNLFFTTAYFGCLPGRGDSKIGKIHSVQQ